MERFCDKCGTLVSGDGSFCPTCGAPMDSVEGSSGAQSGGIDLSKGGSIPSAGVPTPTGSSYQPQPTYSQPSYQQPNYQQTNYSQPTYTQPVYPQTAVQNQEMTVGQWFLTIFLSGLGIIGIILLFVWAFSADTLASKKNYARAMLIFQAIALVLSFILVPVLSVILLGIADELDGAFMGYQFSANLFTALLGK